MNQILKTLIILLLIGLSQSQAITQGLSINDDYLYEQVAVQSLYSTEGQKGRNDPTEGIKSFSLRPYCPSPKDQGAFNSCVSWAVGYGALSIQRAVNNEWYGQQSIIDDNAMSAHFLYDQLAKESVGGRCGTTNIPATLEKLRTTGNLPSAQFDSLRNGCGWKPSTEELARAYDSKIKDYYRIFRNSSNQHFIEYETKLVLLLENRPVIVSMRIGPGFKNLSAENDIWKFDPNVDTILFSHAMVVVGYDDERQAFEIMNSWGKDWGDNGFGWISYTDFAKHCKFAFKMNLDEVIVDRRYSILVDLNKFLAYDLMLNEAIMGGDGLFPVNFKDGYFVATRPIVQESTYQIKASELAFGSYLYVLGVDVKNRVSVHYPSAQEVHSPNSDHLGALVEKQTSSTRIPSAGVGIQFKNVGTEHLIFLVASEPISDLSEKLLLLERGAEDLLTTLYKAFGDRIQKQDYINYRRYGAIYFDNDLHQGATILPAIVRLVVVPKR